MPQTTRFASIPNTDPAAYGDAMSLIYGEVCGSGPSLKALRRFMRMNDLFDKASHETLLDFLDVDTGGEPVTLGPFAEKVIDAKDQPAIRRLVADRMLAMNPLMAKYCIEALDVDQGGRLHSTNELYRMLTSYVYPGEKPDLTAFKGWIDWAAAAGLVRMVGIRWGLGPVGTEVLSRLKAIDVEEFLEEEEETSREEETPQPTPVTPSPERRAAAPEHAAEPAPVPNEEPPKQVIEAGRPEKTRPAPDPSAAQALSDWYARHPSRVERVTPSALGIDMKSDALAALRESGLAALMLARGVSPAIARRVLDAFRQAAVLPAVDKGRLPLESVEKVLQGSGDPSFVRACETVVHLPGIVKAAGKPSDLLLGDGAEGVLWGLYRRMFERAAAPLAPFYLCRLLHEAGRLRPELGPAAFVPTYNVRLNAFRIGLSAGVRATSFGDLVEAALDLGAAFGPPDFEAPLAAAPSGLGCGFACNNTASCPIPCREKSEIGG